MGLQGKNFKITVPFKDVSLLDFEEYTRALIELKYGAHNIFSCCFLTELLNEK
jgi:hypothetical protein